VADLINGNRQQLHKIGTDNYLERRLRAATISQYASVCFKPFHHSGKKW
jgi:hypothetical protein